MIVMDFHESTELRIEIKPLAESGDVLAGSLAGKRLLTKLIEIIREPAEAEPLFLDFKGIATATSSFLRESVIAIRDYCRHRNSKVYPVVANLNDNVREDLEFCLRATDDVMLSCVLDRRGLQTVAILGSLDPKMQSAFDYVVGRDEADATMVWQHYRKQEGVTVNAWNNRLAALSARGVIIEETRGRTKLYRSVLKEK